jgi:predicted GNAT family N-acyltransferase
LIKVISAEATRPLRQSVLRPHQTLNELHYAGDDAPNTLHLGAFKDDALVGIISVYQEATPSPNEGDAWRLRGVATAPEVRGQGYGGQLMQMAIAYVARQGGTLLWCFARTTALPYYERYGFAPQGDIFDTPGTGQHYFIWRSVVPEDILLDRKNQLTSR